MNLFWLDNDLALAAQYHCDKHVVKMTVETAQILSTAVHLRGWRGEGLYRPTHANHPCTVWAAESRANFDQALILLMCLGTEYCHRYGRLHRSFTLAPSIAAAVETVQDWPEQGPTRRPTAMPDAYKTDCIVASYRSYYLAEKRSICKYTNRAEPPWFSTSYE